MLTLLLVLFKLLDKIHKITECSSLVSSVNVELFIQIVLV